MTIDDLAADARVQHVGVSPAGRAVMARTELDEEKLGRLVRGFPPEQRRAFWLGVLLRDGAITVERALRARTGPPPCSETEAGCHGGADMPAVRDAVREAGSPWPADNPVRRMPPVSDYATSAVGRCRGNNCRAPILWCETESGSLMPVDQAEDDRGNVEIVGANQYGHPKVVVHHAPPLFHDGTLHMPHHATCVDIEEFRR